MGVLGWSPSEFWNSTIWDACTAIDGWMMVNDHSQRSKKPDVPDASFMIEMMERFPDK